MFNILSNGKLILVCNKIVYVILGTGEQGAITDFLKDLNDKFMFGAIVHGAYNPHLYGMNIVQNEYYTFFINADDTIQNLEQ